MVELLFGLSIIYTAVIFLGTAILLQTTTDKTEIELAFSIREWVLFILFGVTGILVIWGIDNGLVYRLGVMAGLASMNTIILYAILRAHMQWRRQHGIGRFHIPGIHAPKLTFFRSQRSVDEDNADRRRDETGSEAS